MKIFVSGAGGFQGGSIAQQIIKNNHEVVSLKRNPEGGSQNQQGMTFLKGDLSDKPSISSALKGVDTAVYSLPLVFDMETAKNYTANFIEAAKEENIGLVIFNATFDLPKQETGLLIFDMKVAVKEQFDASGLNVIFLAPDIYIDNLSAPWSIPVILNNNILPYPVASNIKVPWISHTDLGKYVASAIEKPELAGQVLAIGGNQFSGEEIAAAISSHIDKPVNFVSMTPDEFEQQIKSSFGGLAAREISNSYRYLEQNLNMLQSKDFAKTQKLLGVQPESLEDWVQSVNWNLS